MSKVRTAAVIGGGISGPVAAMALQKAGIEATIFEAYPGPADGIGGSLAIAPNGIAALEVIGAHEAVLAKARPGARMMMSVGRKRLTLPSLSGVGPLQVVNRGDLHSALHDLAQARGIPFEYRKRLTHADERGRMSFADGTDAQADVVIGADGVKSTMRTLIDPDAPGPRYTGMLGFEAFSTFDAPGDLDTMTFAFGKRGYYLYWPAAGGGTVWGANLPHPDPMTLVEARQVSNHDWMRRLHDTYGEDDPGGELVRHSHPDSLQVVGSLYIMPRVPHWHRGRMVLVGDAAHAPSNSSGQGASLAIESAIELARCLRDLPDVTEAFAAFENLRRARVEKVAARAARINHAKAPGPITRGLMPILMPLLIKAAMRPEKTIGPEQRYRIPWDTRL